MLCSNTWPICVWVCLPPAPKECVRQECVLSALVAGRALGGVLSCGDARVRMRPLGGRAGVSRAEAGVRVVVKEV